jgi:hypothetical protein
LPPEVTITRASTATAFNPLGQLASFAVNAPRFDHLLDGTALGLLVESATTNLFEYSNDLTQSDWQTSGVDITYPGDWVLGTGFELARVAADTTGGGSRYVRQTVSVVLSQVVSFSGYFVPDEVTKFMLYFSKPLAATGTNVRFVLDTATGAFDLVLNTATVTNKSFVEVSPGLWRFEVSLEVHETSSAQMRVYPNTVYPPSTNLSSDLILGDGYYIGCLQAEVSDAPTSYVDTGATATARAADVLTLTVAGATSADVTATYDDDSTEVFSGVNLNDGWTPTLSRRRVKNLAW